MTFIEERIDAVCGNTAGKLYRIGKQTKKAILRVCVPKTFWLNCV